MRRLPIVALPAALLLLPRSAAAQRPDPIDSMALRAHTYFLAHDLLEGRGTGTRGADVAALYLASAARRIGLGPAGDSGTYVQHVPLVEATLEPLRQRLDLFETDTSGGDIRVRRLQVPPGGFFYESATARTLVPFAGGLVFVGGAADVLAHPQSLPDLRGHVALMRGVFGPAFAAGDTLVARGASGVVHLLGDGRLFQLYAQSRGSSRLMSAPDVAAPSTFAPPLPAVIVHPQLEALFLRGAPGNEGDAPFAIPALRISAGTGWTARPVPARNVVALLPGADSARRHEVVVLSAHYDHLGIAEPDTDGDSVYNGFSDNAAGAAMLLAIAQRLVERPPARSVLFIWFTGEERGLLGSDWFVAHPAVPLARVVGVVNLDAGAPPAASTTWRVAGGTASTLGDLAIAVAREAGWDASLSPPVPNTDYFPFVRSGVPAVFLVPGTGPYEGMTTDSSRAWQRQWDRYHQASDHWRADFPFRGLVRYADYALRLVRALAERPRPVMR